MVPAGPDPGRARAAGRLGHAAGRVRRRPDARGSHGPVRVPPRSAADAAAGHVHARGRGRAAEAEPRRRPGRTGYCGPDQGEQGGLPDALAGQHDQHPVDADPHAAGRRHPVLQRLQEVLVQLHGLRVAARREQRLGGEPAAFLDRVDQLRVPGTELGAERDQVPALGQPRVLPVRPGQRGHVDGEVTVEGGLDGPLLHQPLVHLQHDLAVAPARLGRHPRLGAQLAQPVLAGARVDLGAEGLGDRAVHGLGRPVAAEVILLPGPARHRRPVHGHGRVLDQFPGQGGHGVVVAVGLVRLQHRELGIVGGVHTLVAEDPADLVDLLDTADHQPLQVQFQRDPQEELHVVGVDPGHERARVGAAVHRLQHRRLHLEEAPLVQVGADRLEHGGPDPGHPPGVRVHDQVHITVAHPGLHVAEPPVLFRQRPQALGGDRVAVGEDGQLTAAGGDHLAFHPDVVPEVHVPLPGGQRLRADPVQGDHDLDVAGTVPDRGEAELPAGPGQHDPAGDADPVPGVGVRLQIGVALPDLGDGRGARETHRVGVHALVQQPLALVQPDPHLLRHARILCTGRQRALGPAIPLAILVHPPERTQPFVIRRLVLPGNTNR